MENIKEIRLSKDDFIVDYDNASLKFAYETKGDKYVIDITSLNLIKATKLAILTSTYCFIKNFKKKLCWIVADEQTKSAISILRLSNIEQCIIRPTIEERMLRIS